MGRGALRSRGDNHHDLHDRQLPRTDLTGGCHGLTCTGLTGGWEAAPGDLVGVEAGILGPGF